MFEKKKVEYIIDKIIKYAGPAVAAQKVWDGKKWTINVDIFEDSFTLNFKGIEINFKRRKDGRDS
jgi:hypothetical protein